MTADQLTLTIAQANGLNKGEANIEVEMGLDATGEKAVWVWITLNTWSDFKARQELRDIVADRVREAEGVDFVYVRFRDAAESPVRK